MWQHELYIKIYIWNTLIKQRHCYWRRGQTLSGTCSKLQLPFFWPRGSASSSGKESVVWYWGSVATVVGHISKVDVACNCESLKQKGCTSRGSEMLAERTTAWCNERILNIDPYTCKSNRWINISEVWSFGRVSTNYGFMYVYFYVCRYVLCMYVYTGCHRRNGPNFGRVFLMLNYTDITQNTYIQSSTVMEIMASEVWNFDSCYTLIDYQIHIKTGRNMWFL